MNVFAQTLLALAGFLLEWHDLTAMCQSPEMRVTFGSSLDWHRLSNLIEIQYNDIIKMHQGDF